MDLPIFVLLNLMRYGKVSELRLLINCLNCRSVPLQIPSISSIYLRHRSKFTKDAFQKSALSMHSFEEHSLEHSIDSFEFSILKRTPALNLHREEVRYIEKLRTKTFGLNRMKVIR